MTDVGCSLLPEASTSAAFVEAGQYFPAGHWKQVSDKVFGW
jgi:hypothetical protein